MNLMVSLGVYYTQYWMITPSGRVFQLSDAVEDWLDSTPSLLTSDDYGALLGLSVMRHVEAEWSNRFYRLSLPDFAKNTPIYQDQTQTVWDMPLVVAAFVSKGLKDFAKQFKGELSVTVLMPCVVTPDQRQLLAAILVSDKIKAVHCVPMVETLRRIHPQKSVLYVDHERTDVLEQQQTGQARRFAEIDLIQHFLAFVLPVTEHHQIAAHLGESPSVQIERLIQGLMGVLSGREVEIDISMLFERLIVIKLNEGLIQAWLQALLHSELYQDQIQPMLFSAYTIVAKRLAYFTLQRLCRLQGLAAELHSVDALMHKIAQEAKPSTAAAKTPFELYALQRGGREVVQGSYHLLAGKSQPFPIRFQYSQSLVLDDLNRSVQEGLYVQLPSGERILFCEFTIDFANQFMTRPDSTQWSIELEGVWYQDGTFAITAIDRLYRVPLIIRDVRRCWGQQRLLPVRFVQAINS